MHKWVTSPWVIILGAVILALLVASSNPSSNLNLRPIAGAVTNYLNKHFPAYPPLADFVKEKTA